MPSRSVLKIELSLTKQAPKELTLTPTVLHVTAQDTVVFHSAYPFTVLAKGISPLRSSEFRGRNISPTDARRYKIPPKSKFAKDGVVRGAAPGAYAFACAVYDDGQIYMDAGCPPIIIDPGTNR